jgi:hypothetical protein
MIANVPGFGQLAIVGSCQLAVGSWQSLLAVNPCLGLTIDY